MANKCVEIVRISSDKYIHHQAFDEVVDSLCEGMRGIGYAPVIIYNKVNVSCDFSILIGAHLLSDQALASLPDNVIIYNLEQIPEPSERYNSIVRQSYLDALIRSRIWDYSQKNIQLLRSFYSADRIDYVPIGYSSCLSRLSVSEKDIDVLFYGSLGDRRRIVLDKLKASGYVVHVAFGVYGKERDALIERAKIVINIHHYPSKILEVARVSYLMANAKAVVSECSPNTEVYHHLRDGLCLVPYDGLVDACIDLLGDDSKRKELENNAFLAVQKQSYIDILSNEQLWQSNVVQHKVEEYSANNDSTAGNNGSEKMKKNQTYYDGLNQKLYNSIPESSQNILEIGGGSGRLGKLYKENHPGSKWTNIDKDRLSVEQAKEFLDCALHQDLNCSSLRFPEGFSRFDTVILGDLLEHMTNPEKLLRELYSVTTDSAKIICCLPNATHYSVLQRFMSGDMSYDETGLLDSTHYRLFSQQSAFKVFLDAGWLPSLKDRYVIPVPDTVFSRNLIKSATLLGIPEKTALRNLLTYQMVLECQKYCTIADDHKKEITGVSVIVPVNRPWQFELNINRSPGLKEIDAEIIPVENASSAAEAYSIGKMKAKYQWTLFAHQDVYFPAGSGFTLIAKIDLLEKAGKIDAPTGFAGIARRLDSTMVYSGLVVDRIRLFNYPGTDNAITMDEFAILLHKDAKVIIDNRLGWHTWATDLCLQAFFEPHIHNASIIRIPVFHNSSGDFLPLEDLPKSYHQSADSLLKKYPHLEEIHTLCGTLKKNCYG